MYILYDNNTNDKKCVILPYHAIINCHQFNWPGRPFFKAWEGRVDNRLVTREKPSPPVGDDSHRALERFSSWLTSLAVIQVPLPLLHVKWQHFLRRGRKTVFISVIITHLCRGMALNGLNASPVPQTTKKKNRKKIEPISDLKSGYLSLHSLHWENEELLPVLACTTSMNHFSWGI